MEYSLGSSVNKALASRATAPEESGWTAYFQDFSSSNTNNNNNNNNNNNYVYGESSACSSLGSSSLISDAGSGAAWKPSGQSRHAVECNSSVSGLPKRSKKGGFKKTRNRETPVGDSLEDTASSPVSSPKMERNARKIEENTSFNGSLGKDDNFHGYSEVGTVRDDERNELNFEVHENGCEALKKKGLCLVPLSMLANYLG